MKRLLSTLALSLIIIGSYADPNVDFFEFNTTKTYYPGDTIRIRTFIGGLQPNGLVVFTLRTGPQMTNYYTRSVQYQNMEEVVEGFYTFYYFNFIIPCDAVANTSTSFLNMSYTTTTRIFNLRPSTLADPCSTATPVDPNPITTGIITESDKLIWGHFEAFNMLGVLVSQWDGYYADMRLPDGLYLIVMNRKKSLKIKL